MGKLLPRSCFPVLRNVAPLLVEVKGKDGGLTVDCSDSVAQQQQQPQRRRSSAIEAGVEAETAPAAAARDGTRASTGLEQSFPAMAGKLFVFRDPPQSCDLEEPPRRKKRKNFLNLKKSSVAPTDLP